MKYYEATQFPTKWKLVKDLSPTPKIPLNQNSRRCFTRDIAKVHYFVTQTSPNSKPLVEHKKHLAQPPG